MNGSGVAGVAQTEATKLESQGYTVGMVGNAPTGDYGKYSIYQIGEGNSGTASKLKKLYGVEIKKTTPPVTVPAATKFVVIVGQSVETSSASN